MERQWVVKCVFFVGCAVFAAQADAQLVEERFRAIADTRIKEADEESSRISIVGPQSGLSIGSRSATEYSDSYANETPSVIVEWVAPEVIVLGHAADFELLIRNRGSVAIENIEIKQAIPEGFELVQSKPVPFVFNEQKSWNLKRLEPDEEYKIELRLKPSAIGTAECHAQVRYTTASMSRFKVVQPKLDLKMEVAETVVLGGQSIFLITVSNPGTGPATNVAVDVEWSEGFYPRKSAYEVGTLNAGESRSLRLLANARMLGQQTCRAVATADFDLLAETESEVKVLGADLVARIEGPKFRYVTRPADYEIVVTNTGTAEATNVQIGCAIPKQFQFKSASDNGRYDATTGVVHWSFGTLPAGKTAKVACKIVTLDRGDFQVRARAIADRGIVSDDQQTTKVEGIAAMLLEVVDADDPIEVGAGTLYEIVVNNQGTDFAKNVVMVVDVPAALEIDDVKGPVKAERDGQKLKFVIERLAPRADAVFRIAVKARRPGDARLQVSVNAESLDSPVIEQESTKVYQD